MLEHTKYGETCRRVMRDDFVESVNKFTDYLKEKSRTVKKLVSAKRKDREQKRSSSFGRGQCAKRVYDRASNSVHKRDFCRVHCQLPRHTTIRSSLELEILLPSAHPTVLMGVITMGYTRIFE